MMMMMHMLHACLDDIAVEEGSMRDYALLARFHYRSGPPATVARVYRAVVPSACVIERFQHRFASARRETVGVLVVSHPHLCCAMRNAALAGRYRGFDRRTAARLVNDEVRTISRVIVDPRCRGLGLAVRLVAHALEHADTVYTEAVAAMGRINPFFEKAGMMRFDPPRTRDAARFEAALEMVHLPAHELASASLICSRINSLNDPAQREWFMCELRRFARSRGRGDQRRPGSIPFAELIRLARLRLWSRPTYYLHRSERT